MTSLRNAMAWIGFTVCYMSFAVVMVIGLALVPYFLFGTPGGESLSLLYVLVLFTLIMTGHLTRMSEPVFFGLMKLFRIK